MNEKNTPINEIPIAEEIENLPVSEDYDPALENIRRKFSIRQFLRDAPGIMFSFIIHGIVLVILAFYSLPAMVDFRPDLVANLEDLGEIEDVDIFEEEPVEINLDETNDVTEIDTTVETMTTELSVPETEPAIATSDLGNLMAPDTLISKINNTGDLGGRNNRGTAVAGSGGSEASEKSVAGGIQWIAEHQLPNGSWSYTQLRNPNCRGKCKDATMDTANRSYISATAMALLPMLGCGITHKEGKYKKEVKAGLDYITGNYQMRPEGIILAEKGSTPVMYHQGLTTIVVCEAAAMTRDKNLEKIAQGAINYIVWAQDPVGGGWRYSPKQPGDTSGMGWNFMALKSAQMAYLNVPPRTIRGAKHFLDNVVGIEGGAKYGYESAKDGPKLSLTPIGLLGQMYMGWKADRPELIKGTDYVSNAGPQLNNIYYCYYATQVMRHIGGEKWDKWNKQIRDELVKRQITEGHEKGSWSTDIGGSLVGGSGGRLTCTAFATMILEVYYRHLPLYRKTTTVDAFPLE
ncbi:MAG: hypothetical protein LBU34_03425 [Planctomycetaceae bacterium]|jgi:hypothetical protein|nr:hypothetical protein [Planctomycetaceae bacterium]